MRILAIETSCDETAASVVRRDEGDDWVSVETSVVASQATLHAKYGGVYPEVASREHVRRILPVVAEALGLPLRQKGRLPDCDLTGIDAIAVTHGPGLIGSLLVGTQTAATLAMVTGLPLMAINHLAGHIYAAWISDQQSAVGSQPLKSESWELEAGKVATFPLLALIVSGGHTMLVRMTGHHRYELLGQTRDDAAGEAFDKVAKLLGLGYPGGPQISRLASRGDRHAYDFPIGLQHENTLDFSFSGLKTAVLREVEKIGTLSATIKADLAASFERAVIEALLLRVSQALDQLPVADVILGGGVAANVYLRQRLAALLAHRDAPAILRVPPMALCTDNAAVIGAAALFGPIAPVDPARIATFSRLPLTRLT